MTRAEQTKLEQARGTHIVSKHTREEKLDQWYKEGRIKIMPFLRFTVKDSNGKPIGSDAPSDFTTVQVGEVYFNDPNDVYPSEELFAKVALAINVGYDCLKRIQDYDPVTGIVKLDKVV